MRPEGWENPNKLIASELAYEAGADAMLEGLKKEGIPLEPYDCDNFINRSGVKGYLVFIPEEGE